MRCWASDSDGNTAAVCPDGHGFAVLSHLRDNEDPMSMPTWWNQRRFGIFVHSNLATVPAWSPIGEYSDWYRSHLGEDVADVVLHPRPMVEVLAHHRDRWGHIEHFDDFLPLLTYDRFDAEDWARLVTDAGAGYSILVAKHHDGWCWWDAPNTDRTVVHGGPGRNVLAEYAAACERNDIVFGTYYSLLDWGDARYPDPAYVSEVLHPHVVDLVERYGSSVLWGDGHWGHGPEFWRTGELLDRIRAIDPDIVVNDRWWASADDVPAGSPALVRTFEYQTPDDITDDPWELCRGIGASFCHNRAERAEHHMSGFDIVALLTEVVAKGGHLLLNIGPAADGTIPELQRAPLESAGRWIRAHQQLIDRAVPWDSWGDVEVRYLCLDGEVHVVDLSGRGRFSAITPDRYRVSAVEREGSPVRFSQHDDGLHVDGGRSALERRTRAGRVEDVPVYRVTLAPVEKPVELFEPQPRRPIQLDPLLGEARPGDIVQLGDGTYVGPITVPAGVIVRGLGAGRTTIDGGGATAVVLERNARLEHLRVGGGPSRLAWFPCPIVEVRGPYATLLGCRVDGHVIVRADDVVIRAISASGVVADGADRLTVSRSQFRGMRWDVGVHLIGGAGHEIDSCQLRDHLCGIRANETTGTIVRGNNIVARWWGIHLEQTEGAHVYGNFVDHTMRGIDIDGGTQAVIDGNAICDGDSGCIVEWGASDCQVSGNRWERCRIGILSWEVTALHAHDNTAIDLHEPDAAHATGP
jgi:alpha-L-fucosidase